jgi:CelD/BcsL family acetyltransferase involved in cellulose biosynthesis
VLAPVVTSTSLVTATPPGATLRCSVVSDPARLEACRPVWLGLLDRGAANEVMLTPMWLLPWWRIFGNLDGRQLRVGQFYEGERLIGLAPLLRRRHWHRRAIPFRRLEPLGSGESAGEQVWSDYLNVLAERGAEEQVAVALANALVAGTFGSWDELVLPRMDGDGPMPALLNQALARRGMWTECVPAGAAPYVPLPGTWDAYLQALSSSHRYFLKRALRDFEQWAGGDVELRSASSPEELEEGHRILVELHTERWEADGGRGVFGSPRFRAFHEAVQREMLQAGALDLLWLRARGQPVAAVYNLRWAGKVSFYQSGRCTDLPANVRPGVALHAYAIRRAIEAGLREYDFLAGVSRYKMQFALATRPLVELRAARRSPAEWARRQVERGAAWARATRDAAGRLGGWWRARRRRNDGS